MENLKEIIDFLENRDSLTPTQRQTFELKIRTDREFAKSVAFVLASRKNLQEETSTQISAERQERFNKLGREMNTLPYKKNQWFFYTGASIAACILIFACYWWLKDDTIIRHNSSPTLMHDTIKIKKDSIRKDSIKKKVLMKGL